MSEPQQGPCTPWATLDDAQRLRGVPSGSGGPDLDKLEAMLGAASALLYEATGRRWPGVCSNTVRPCGVLREDDRRPAWHGELPTSWDSGGAWSWEPSWGTCLCNQPRSGECGCLSGSMIRLGGEPIVTVDEVLIDGDVLDPARYTVHDYRWLVRLPDADGTAAHWPCCQRLDLPPTEPGTFEVTYGFGTRPADDGVLANVDLALELVKAGGSGPCSLPDRVVSMVRQGVTVALVDPLAVVQAGGFGVYTVDLFVGRYPSAQPASVHVPGRGSRVRRDTGAT